MPETRSILYFLPLVMIKGGALLLSRWSAKIHV